MHNYARSFSKNMTIIKGNTCTDDDKSSDNKGFAQMISPEVETRTNLKKKVN